MSKKKIPTEKETKENLLGWAKRNGLEQSLLKLYARYEDLLKGAKSEEERKAIQVMGISEFNNFFGRDRITFLKFKDNTTMSLDDKNIIVSDSSDKNKKG